MVGCQCVPLCLDRSIQNLGDLPLALNKPKENPSVSLQSWESVNIVLILLCGKKTPKVCHSEIL